MKAYAVIGANYGDEGKGVVTDRLVSDLGAPVVVRSNGGAQAGHTVCPPSGRRHVFHHIGAGTFAGADTYLSRFFVCNPILFNQEDAELGKMGKTPLVMVDPDCLVTTPWDMMANQLIESSRGLQRHGSCGVGFNETIERSQDPAYRLTVAHLGAERTIRSWSRRVLRYFTFRLAEFAMPVPSTWLDDGLLEHWVADAISFASRVKVVHQEYIRRFDHIVFEGAQGLKLDQNNRHDFPHLTRSNTGLRNPTRFAAELGVRHLEAIYVTRTYLTRHGAGPLPREGKLPFVPNDTTNVDHPWQGELRYAPLDSAALQIRIRRDFNSCGMVDLQRSASLAMTHLDAPAIVDDREQMHGHAADISTVLANRVQLAKRYAFYGPGRGDVLVSPAKATVE